MTPKQPPKAEQETSFLARYQEALAKAGSTRGVAKLLGIPRTTLRRKLEKCNASIPDRAAKNEKASAALAKLHALLDADVSGPAEHRYAVYLEKDGADDSALRAWLADRRVHNGGHTVFSSIIATGNDKDALSSVVQQLNEVNNIHNEKQGLGPIRGHVQAMRALDADIRIRLLRQEAMVYVLLRAVEVLLEDKG